MLLYVDHTGGLEKDRERTRCTILMNNRVGGKKPCNLKMLLLEQKRRQCRPHVANAKKWNMCDSVLFCNKPGFGKEHYLFCKDVQFEGIG